MILAPIPLSPQLVPKAWGYEMILCNNTEFCGKILHFREGTRFSMHFHKDKREVFFLQKGMLRLVTINTEDASQLVTIMHPGHTIEIPRLLPHQITALEESDLIEFSTTHRDEDSFRVSPGDSQSTPPTL